MQQDLQVGAARVEFTRKWSAIPLRQVFGVKRARGSEAEERL